MEIRLAPLAISDIEKTLNYLKAESPSSATSFSARLEAILEILAEFPLNGRLTTRARMRYVNMHPFPYLVFYKPSRSMVEIIAVRHGARNLRSMPARPR